MDDKLKPKPIHLDTPIDVDMSGWESPIQMMCREISRQHEEAVEGMIWHSLNEIGIEIDKERLIAVIEGDRKSYEDGYRKGYEDGVRDEKNGKMTRFEKWIEDTFKSPYSDDENPRKQLICEHYMECEKCPLYKPCMVDSSEEEYDNDKAAYNARIDRYLDEEVDDDEARID